MTLTETLTVLTIPKLTGPTACSQSACVLVEKVSPCSSVCDSSRREHRAAAVKGHRTLQTPALTGHHSAPLPRAVHLYFLSILGDVNGYGPLACVVLHQRPRSILHGQLREPEQWMPPGRAAGWACYRTN